MCAERQSAVLRGAVVWERTDVGPARILPDGCTDLIWTGEDLIVADPDTTAHISTLSAPNASSPCGSLRASAPACSGRRDRAARSARLPLEAIWAAGDVRRSTSN